MKLFENLKQVRSTVIGLICLGFALWGSIRHEDYNTSMFWTLLAVGILLLFVPDTFVGKLGDILSKLIGWVFGTARRNDSQDSNF